MSRSTFRNNPLAAGYSYDIESDGSYTPVAIEMRTPATELELAENPAGEDALLYAHIRILRWLFEKSVLSFNGTLQTPAGIAVRMLCLASLLKLEPVDAMSFEQIARHCGVTRAAISKTMLNLSAITGIRSRQQRSDDARYAYRQRAIQVHRRKKDADITAPTTEAEDATPDRDSVQ